MQKKWSAVNTFHIHCTNLCTLYCLVPVLISVWNMFLLKITFTCKSNDAVWPVETRDHLNQTTWSVQTDLKQQYSMLQSKSKQWLNYDFCSLGKKMSVHLFVAFMYAAGQNSALVCTSVSLWEFKFWLMFWNSGGCKKGNQNKHAEEQILCICSTLWLSGDKSLKHELHNPTHVTE